MVPLPAAAFPCVVSVDVAEIAARPDLLVAVREQVVQAVVVRGALAGETAALVVDAAEAGALASAPAPEGESVRLFGAPLQWARPDLALYLDEAAAFRRVAPSLFAGVDYEARVRVILGALGGGVPVEPMRARAGAAYTPSTIRRLGDGGAIPPHFENHQLGFPACASVRAAIDARAVLSFFTLLQAPSTGGELVVHAMTLADHARLARPNAATLAAALAGHAAGAVPFAVGDLVVFDSGRFAHEVTPVGGARARWTIGGLLAWRRGGDRVVYWG